MASTGNGWAGQEDADVLEFLAEVDSLTTTKASTTARLVQAHPTSSAWMVEEAKRPAAPETLGVTTLRGPASPDQEVTAFLSQLGLHGKRTAPAPLPPRPTTPSPERAASALPTRPTPSGNDFVLQLQQNQAFPGNVPSGVATGVGRRAADGPPSPFAPGTNPVTARDQAPGNAPSKRTEHDDEEEGSTFAPWSWISNAASKVTSQAKSLAHDLSRNPLGGKCCKRPASSLNKSPPK
jgi:hypothetical protein